MKYVLFVCTHNAGRSQIAQAFFERHAPDDIRAESAGTDPRKEGVWPDVVEVMREIGSNLPAIRSDRTAHQMRLARLLPGLAEDFGESHTAAQIRARTDEMLEEFIDVPVRSFVLTLARRKTQECPRHGHCAPAAA